MSGLGTLLKPMLDAGISVVSVEYRFLGEAAADGVTPPVKGPMFDVARALQFVRSKAADWNIDKNRVAASGGRLAPAQACGWRSMMIWQTRKAAIRWRVNPPGFAGWRYLAPRRRSIRSR
jgi:hypothetical protein